MYTILLTLHILVCVTLIITVLLQSAKGEGLAGAFGGSSISSAVFGGRGAASFLSRATTVLAIAFMLTSIVLTFTISRTGFAGSKSVITEAAQKGQVPVPQTSPQVPASGDQQPASGGKAKAPDINLPPPPETGKVTR